MKLRKENPVDCPSDSLEYRQAVKYVIRCQIETLLQKLASETGEESFLISTNVMSGTYNLLGSFLGREYMEEREDFVQNACQMFSSFCSEAHSQGAVLKIPDLHFSEDTQSRKTISLPRPKLMPRKRSLNSTSPGEASNAKRKVNNKASPDAGSPPVNGGSDVRNYASTISGVESDCLQAEVDGLIRNNDSGENRNKNKIWVKQEPIDEGDAQEDLDMEDWSKLQDSIINRPRSLIPLANISKKYGGSRVKLEKQDVNNDSGHTSEMSILRSLCESQPVFPMPDFGADGRDSPDGSLADENLSISLRSKLADDVDNLNSTTENLVLSGYYDSDTYPSYRHRQKHPHYGQTSKRKKEKSAISGTPGGASSSGNSGCGGNSSSVDTPISPGNVDIHLRTFESGGRLVYACDVCKRELSHLTSYRRHMKLHTMERPHKCPVCDKGFIRKYHCIDHLNKHHKGVEFDPDSLTLIGPLPEREVHEQDHSAMSDSLSVSPSEYNYTMDHSIGDISLTEPNQSLSSIDQTASTMLSELAKSAQMAKREPLLSAAKYDLLTTQLKLKSEAGESLSSYNDCLSEEAKALKGDDVCAEIIQSEDGKSDANLSESETERSEKSSPGSTGSLSGGMSRKTEVSEGIKAIVAHLKMASKNKRKNIPRAAEVMKVGMDDG